MSKHVSKLVGVSLLAALLVGCGSAVVRATESGDIAALDKATQEQDLNALDDMGWAPLHHAASAGQPEAVRFLLNKGARPETKSSSGQTALHVAAGPQNRPVIPTLFYTQPPVEDKRETILSLVKGGADINAEDKHGFTPLMTACLFFQNDKIPVLIEARADINKKTGEGKTALKIAEKVGNHAAVEILRQAGAK